MVFVLGDDLLAGLNVSPPISALSQVKGVYLALTPSSTDLSVSPGSGGTGCPPLAGFAQRSSLIED